MFDTLLNGLFGFVLEAGFPIAFYPAFQLEFVLLLGVGLACQAPLGLATWRRVYPAHVYPLHRAGNILLMVSALSLLVFAGMSILISLVWTDGPLRTPTAAAWLVLGAALGVVGLAIRIVLSRQGFRAMLFACALAAVLIATWWGLDHMITPSLLHWFGVAEPIDRFESLPLNLIGFAPAMLLAIGLPALALRRAASPAMPT